MKRESFRSRLGFLLVSADDAPAALIKPFRAAVKLVARVV